MMASRSAELAVSQVSEVFRAFCIGMDTARSLKAAILLRYGDFDQLLRMKIHPTEYVDHALFARDYAVVSFLKKNADLPKITDTREMAVAAFKRSEDVCKQTNERFAAIESGDTFMSPDVCNVLHIAQRKISRLLGASPNVSSGPYKWGPGASYELNSSAAYPDTKLVALPFTVTGSAWKHAAAIINSDLHWKEAVIAANPGYSGPVFKIVPGGRYDTVPKTVLTDRSILIEPRLNMILQKRVGAQIRDLLKTVGVDLDDQTRNQNLAGLARTLGLATLDLEAASDSVARKLVQFLLPPMWFEYLDDVRSKWVEIDGTSVRLEKFSSMGNGFTFELESLIFWSLAAAASEMSYYTTIGIYGDDIIVRSEVAPLLTEALTFCGFTLNREKSFVGGEFFESCGKHYFGGYDVTPAYQKCCPTTGYEWARLCNRLMRLSFRMGYEYEFNVRVRPAWECAIRLSEAKPDQLGPYVGIGDGYFEAPVSRLKSHRTKSYSHGFSMKVVCYSPTRREIPACDEAMYALSLMQTITSAFPRHSHWKGRSVAALPLSEPSVSVKKTRSGLSVSSLTADSGFISTRLKTPYHMIHRWVEIPLLATAPDW